MKIDDILPDILEETRIIRQFRRYGGKLSRQFRCMGGPKKGRLVTSPSKCGIRKDPKKVRQGKINARHKKGQRIRKTQFTKRKTATKRLMRFNKMMAGKTNIK